MKDTYIYIINYPDYEKSLCSLEIKSLFAEDRKIIFDKVFLSHKYIDVSKSTYVKEQIRIIYKEDNILDITKKIIQDKLSYDDFKIVYIKLEKPDISYKRRMELIRDMGISINGYADIHQPKIYLCITKLGGKWIFGEYIKNDFLWHIHDQKPHSYSNSLSTRVSRALVNIAVNGNYNKTLIDPCCGIGTVVLEALSMNIDAYGSDINKQIASRARSNIEFFGYDRKRISFTDINDIKSIYDAGIIDIPYGVFTKTTLDIQKNIISCGRNVSRRMVFITFEDMSEIIISSGFNIIDRGYVNKGKFKRYIEICE